MLAAKMFSGIMPYLLGFFLFAVILTFAALQKSCSEKRKLKHKLEQNIEKLDKKHEERSRDAEVIVKQEQDENIKNAKQLENKEQKVIKPLTEAEKKRQIEEAFRDFELRF